MQLELGHLPATERIAREHALDGFVQHALGMLTTQNLAGRHDLQTARIMAVGGVGLRVELVAGETHLAGVDNDHVLASVNVRSVFGSVLSAKNRRDLHGEASDDLIGAINKEPALWQIALRADRRAVALLDHERGH